MIVRIGANRIRTTIRIEIRDIFFTVNVIHIVNTFIMNIRAIIPFKVAVIIDQCIINGRNTGLGNYYFHNSQFQNLCQMICLYVHLENFCGNCGVCTTGFKCNE